MVVFILYAFNLQYTFTSLVGHPAAGPTPHIVRPASVASLASKSSAEGPSKRPPRWLSPRIQPGVVLFTDTSFGLVTTDSSLARRVKLPAASEAG